MSASDCNPTVGTWRQGGPRNSLTSQPGQDNKFPVQQMTLQQWTQVGAAEEGTSSSLGRHAHEYVYPHTCVHMGTYTCACAHVYTRTHTHDRAREIGLELASLSPPIPFQASFPPIPPTTVSPSLYADGAFAV